MSLRVTGNPPASRARTTPPAFGLSGLCRPPRWGGSGRFLRGWGIGVEKPPHFNSRNKSGGPCPSCRAGRARAAARLFRSLQLGLGAGCGGASGCAPRMRALGRLLVGAEDTAGARSQRSTKVLLFTPPPSPPALCPRTLASAPPHRDSSHSVPIRSQPSFHRDFGQDWR